MSTIIGLPGFGAYPCPEFSGRRRLFKKLCKRAHSLLVRWDPHCEGQTMRHTREDWASDWLGSNSQDRFGRDILPLKGTLGFGRMSGYYEPEWDDESAYSALRASVFWHFIEHDADGEASWPEHAPDLADWRCVIAAAERIVCVRCGQEGHRSHQCKKKVARN